MYKFFFILIGIVINSNVYCQNNSIVLNFNASFQNNELVLDSTYVLNEGKDSISFSQLKFYISDISFFNNKRKVFAQKNSYHLIDFSNKNSKSVLINLPHKLKFNHIIFNLGIDSFTNSKGVSSGNLDPLLGMYWAWHSGYINIKFEGKSNLCNSQLNEFKFHLGGFLNGFLACTKITTSTISSNKITYIFLIDDFIKNINLKEHNLIMSPSKKAVEISSLFKESLKQIN